MTDNLKTTVLILAGGSLKNRAFGPAPALSTNPANLANGSSLARQYIINHYKKQTELISIKILIDNKINDMYPNIINNELEPIAIQPQKTILSSIRNALPKITTPWLLIQPITTLPSQPADSQCWIELGEQAIPQENWSAIKAPTTDTPIFLSKNENYKHDSILSFPFTGIISAPTDLLKDLTNRIKSSALDDDSDLLSLAQKLWETQKASFRFSPWRDLGHRATFNLTRLEKLRSRSFNSVRYCEENDTIIKTSSDQERLKQEARYIYSLPSSIARYFPALINYSPNNCNEINFALETEYIPFPNLSELFLHWDIGANGWIHIMKRLKLIQEAMHDSSKNTNVGLPRENVRWLYSDKLKSRLEKLAYDPPLLELMNHSWKDWWESPTCLKIVNNSKRYNYNQVNLPSPENSYQELIKCLKSTEDLQMLQLIHGDLCFNNILADPLSGSVQLIDPRGEQPTGAFTPIGFGDKRYDMVKLLHSGRYLYDSISNDLFDINILSPALVELEIHVPRHYHAVNNAINKHFISNSLNQYDERYLTSSLFLSMLPLHKENGKRCVAFTCIAQLIMTQQFNMLV